METKLGKNGEKLLEYVKWLHDRIIALRKDESYQPVLHIDVYGTMGIAFDNDLEKIADYMKTLCDAAAPFHLRIEGPVDVATARSRWKLCGISPPSATRRTSREIVADEWCNTLEDIIYFADNKAGHMIQIKTPTWAA